MIRFEKDNEGKISALETNMAEMNRLQSQILSDILERLSVVSASELSIPVGTLTGTPLLAGRGPRIPVKMEFVGSSNARFDNDFTEAGINQTKHRVLLYVDVSVSILLPGFSTYTKVTNAFTVAETVIVGSVPQTYTYFSTAPDESDDYAEDYILNNG
jgi:sporulation protein YunB